MRRRVELVLLIIIAALIASRPGVLLHTTRDFALSAPLPGERARTRTMYIMCARQCRLLLFLMPTTVALAASVEPFSFRLRATPTAINREVSAPAEQFAWTIAQLHSRKMQPIAAEAGEWSNWTDFTPADAKAASAAEPNMREPSFGYLVLGVETLWTPAPTAYAMARVEIEFSRKTGTPDAPSGPPVAQVAARLGFRPLIAGVLKSPSAVLGLMIPPGLDSLDFQTYREFNNRTFYQAFPPAPAKLPRLFPLMDRLIGDDDIDGERLGVEALSQLGYTGLSCMFANGPNTKALFAQAGVPWTTAAGHIPNFGFGCGSACRESNISTDAQDWFGLALAAGFSSSDFKLTKIADEPGWYYPSTTAQAANSSAAVARWHTMLRELAKLTPPDLLLGATEWNEILFAGRSHANGTVEDRRRFYWTTRFFSLDSAAYYANSTKVFEAALAPSMGYSSGLFANWNNFGR